jgi:hypothetical protein
MIASAWTRCPLSKLITAFRTTDVQIKTLLKTREVESCWIVEAFGLATAMSWQPR